MWRDLLANNQMSPAGQKKKRTKDLPHNHRKIIPPAAAAAFTPFPRRRQPPPAAASRRQLTPSYLHIALDLRYHPGPPTGNPAPHRPVVFDVASSRASAAAAALHEHH
jgi:hypothetical protein